MHVGAYHIPCFWKYMRNLAFARRNKISAADFTRKQNALFPDRVKSALADAFDMWCLWDFFFRIWILSIWPIAACVRARTSRMPLECEYNHDHLTWQDSSSALLILFVGLNI